MPGHNTICLRFVRQKLCTHKYLDQHISAIIFNILRSMFNLIRTHYLCNCFIADVLVFLQRLANYEFSILITTVSTIKHE